MEFLNGKCAFRRVLEDEFADFVRRQKNVSLRSLGARALFDDYYSHDDVCDLTQC